jgi:hypothetical protein
LRETDDKADEADDSDPLDLPEDDLAADDESPGKRSRKGQRRCGQEELEERIDFAAHLIASKRYPSDVKRLLKKQYKISRAQAERYMSRARDVVVGWSGKTKEEHRVESLALYESIIRKSVDDDRRMNAQARIDRLLGLEAPAEMNVRGESFKVYLGFNPAEVLCEQPSPEQTKSPPSEDPTSPSAPPSD